MPSQGFKRYTDMMVCCLHVVFHSSFSDKSSKFPGMAWSYRHHGKLLERETLHLFQPPRADQMPGPHQGQGFPYTSQCLICIPMRVV